MTAPTAGRSCAERKRSAGSRWCALAWASLLALSPMSSAQGEDEQPPSDAIAETGSPPASEPEPAAVVESADETPATEDARTTDEEIEPRADDDERAGESEPPLAEPAADVFVPSEDISEDFAVPFPVDI